MHWTVEVVNKETDETDYIEVDDLTEIDLKKYIIVDAWEN